MSQPAFKLYVKAFSALIQASQQCYDRI